MTPWWWVLLVAGTAAEVATRPWSTWPPRRPDPPAARRPRPTDQPFPVITGERSLAEYLDALYDLPAADREDRRAA